MNQTQYIESLFSGNPNFGKRCSIWICRNGAGIDQMILKIVLPELPNGVFYKKYIIYDLIKNITMWIGGTEFFNYTGEQLQIIDKIERSYYDILEFTTIKNNIIYYPLDLKLFFKKAKFIEKSNNEILNIKFKGFRLCNSDHMDMRFNCTVGSIFDIIEGNIQEQVDYLQKLELKDFLCLCHYIIPDKKIIRPNNSKVIQKFIYWKGESFKNGSLIVNHLKINIDNNIQDDSKILKMILFYNMDNNITHHLLQVNGSDKYDKTETKETNLLYQFNNKKKLDDKICAIDLKIKIKKEDKLNLHIWMEKELCENDQINYLFKLEKKVLYDNDMFGFYNKKKI